MLFRSDANPSQTVTSAGRPAAQSLLAWLANETNRRTTKNTNTPTGDGEGRNRLLWVSTVIGALWQFLFVAGFAYRHWGGGVFRTQHVATIECFDLRPTDPHGCTAIGSKEAVRCEVWVCACVRCVCVCARVCVCEVRRGYRAARGRDGMERTLYLIPHE